jgi:hypothetical protein
VRTGETEPGDAAEQETAAAAEQLARTRAELAAQAVRAEQERAREVREQSEAQEAAAKAEADRIVLLGRSDAKERARVVERDIQHQVTRLAELKDQVVVTEDLAMLQEAGVYEYRTGWPTRWPTRASSTTSRTRSRPWCAATRRSFPRRAGR